MRTKALVLTAVLGVAGIANSFAQGAVYSVNAVGYVNITLKPGFQMIANPLDNKNSNGNTISNLLAGVPDGTTVYKFNSTLGVFSGNALDFGEWAAPNQTLVPGEGAFVKLPGAANVTVTFVGEVKQGTLSTAIPKGFSIAASQVPQAGKIQTDLKFTPAEGDTVYSYDVATQKYIGRAFEFGAWSEEPTLAVGEAVFINSASAKSWDRSFDVNNP